MGGGFVLAKSAGDTEIGINLTTSPSYATPSQPRKKRGNSVSGFNRVKQNQQSDRWYARAIESCDPCERAEDTVLNVEYPRFAVTRPAIGRKLRIRCVTP